MFVLNEQLIQELKKENFDLKLRLYMEQKEREVCEIKHDFCSSLFVFLRLCLLLSVSHHGDYTLFYKNNFYKDNEAQICPKIKNKLRTIETRLQIQM